MTTFLQPPAVDLATLDDERFLSPEETENWQEAIEREAAEAEQRKFDDYERRRQAAHDRIRREKEEADLSGTLPADAEVFLESRLRPFVIDAHDYQPTIRTPIVDGLFFQNSLTWVAGQSGTFKSFVTADLAFRYGSEGEMDFHGKRMTHGRALLIIAEGSAGYAGRRIVWEKHHGRNVKNVNIYPFPIQLGDTLKEMPALRAYLKEEADAGRPYGLVLFDTQAMCTVGVDENTSEMNRVINVLHRIREVNGACVMVVHHFGKKAESGMRGSSMIYAAADTVCVLGRNDRSNRVTLSTAQEDGGKQKDAITENSILTFDMKAYPVGPGFFEGVETSLVPTAVESPTVQDPEDIPPAALAPVSDLQLYYLRGLGTYEADGVKPSYFRDRMEDTDWLGRIGLPPEGHRVTRTSPSNQFQALKTKGMAEQIGQTGGWRITPTGVAKLAQVAMDRAIVEDSWLDPKARRRTVHGAVHERTELS